MKNPPHYGITSVDHALSLAVTLQVEGPLTVSAAADRLGVARSTAHRLLSMLVYRDFAVQRSDRSYDAGPVLSLASASRSRTARLRELALPHLEALAEAVRESTNLLIRAGRHSRFIASVEGDQVLRVSSREGMVFPAHLTTGGRLMLADLTEDELVALYAGTSEDEPRVDVGALSGELRVLRERGFAMNVEETETGLTAVGYPLRGDDGRVHAAISVGLPSSRFSEAKLPVLVGALAGCARAIEAELRADLAGPAGRTAAGAGNARGGASSGMPPRKAQRREPKAPR